MKSILITGASKGIGKAAAIHFLNEGWFVGATDIDKEALNKFATEYKHENLYTSLLDVTDEAAAKKVFKEFCDLSNGKLNVLFNNAGVAWFGDFEEIPIKHHLTTIEVNTKGMLGCAYHAFPYLKNTKDAIVINMCSASAHYGVPFAVSYSATKFFVKGFTEALNLEWERYGIHVCDIMANLTKTPMTDKLESPVVKNVGINLTTDDVVKKIWKATQKKKVHWLVEAFPYNIIQPLAKFLPDSVVRAIVKKTAEL